MTLSTRCGTREYILRAMILLLAIVVVPVLLGAWREGGKGINPSYVGRIKDGQTQKHEVLLLFGDPQEVERTPEGVVFTYKSYVDEPPPPSKSIYKEPDPQSLSRYVIDDNMKLKKPTVKKEGKILKATLVVRFKPGSETVLSHEYKEVGEKK